MREYIKKGVVVIYNPSSGCEPESLGMTLEEEYVIGEIKRDTTSSAPYTRVRLKTVGIDPKNIMHPVTQETFFIDHRYVRPIMNGPSDPKRMPLPKNN
jgi:hypothetical protein